MKLNPDSHQRNWLLLGLICIIAVAIRTVQLGQLPAILNPDEAAIAYNAYLLSQTGLDEWGRVWPITLQSFGDYKLLGYPAIVAWLFSWLPISEFVVRLPAALAGTSIVLLSVWWSRWLALRNGTQLVVALLAALSPVFFFYSRMAFEALVALSLFISVILLLVWPKFSDRLRPIVDLAAIVLMTIACSTYNTPLLLLPACIIGLVWWRGIQQVRSWIIPVTGFVVLGLGMSIALQEANSQKSAITIFSDPGVWERAVVIRENLIPPLAWVARPQLYYIKLIVEHFVKSFGYGFLVVRGGGHPWHSLPYWGHLFGIQYILAVLGLSVGSMLTLQLLLRHPLRSVLTPLSTQQNGCLLLTLFFTVAGLLPAVITVDAPHATRSLLFLFLLLVWAGVGLEYSLRMISTRFAIHLKSLVLTIVVMAIFISSSQYLWTYFTWYPSNHPSKLPVGFDTVIQRAISDYPNQEVAVVDTDGTLYVYASWYARYTPEYFFATVKKQLPTQIGFRYGERVGQFHFIAQLADRSSEVAAVYHDGNEWIISP